MTTPDGGMGLGGAHAGTGGAPHGGASGMAGAGSGGAMTMTGGAAGGGPSHGGSPGGGSPGGGSAGGSPGGSSVGGSGASGPSTADLPGWPFAAPRFIAPQRSRDGSSWTRVVDVDGDGWLDLFALGYDLSSRRPSTWVSFHDRDGVFHDPVVSTLGSTSVQTEATVFTDVNGDGHLDLLFALTLGPAVHVILGRGDGSFTEIDPVPINSVEDTGSLKIAVADVNGDGKPDLIANGPVALERKVFVLIGKGDGKFGAATTYPLTVNAYGAPLVSDVNRDGLADVIVAGYETTVFLNKSDGRLGTPTVLRSSAFTDALTVADLDGDGMLDLLTMTGNARGRSLGIAFNRGGMFATPQILLSGELAALATADLNGDGRLDLIAGTTHFANDPLGATTDGLHVLINEGNGFAAPVTYFGGMGVTGVAVGDLDGDGHPDVAANVAPTEYADTSPLHVLFNTGDGTLADPVALAGNGLVTAIADLDHDGDADIIADDGTVLFANGGGGRFARQVRSDTATPSSSASLADLDGDGKLDLVCGGVDDASVLMGRGDGTFGPATRFAAMTGPPAPAIGDLDGDGKPDVVMGFAGPSGTVRVAMNEGSGRIRPYVSWPSGPYVTAVAVADFDGNGKGDIVAAVAGGISVLLNDGQSRFPSHVEYGRLDAQAAMAVADVDGDGKPDVVTVGKAATSVLRNRGDGTFEPPVAYAGGGQALALVDLTGDGRPEVVVGGTPDLTILPNQGDGTFATGVAVAGPNVVLAVRALSTADVSGDGRPDLLALYPGAYATIFFGDGAGGLARGDTYSINGAGIALSDLNGDRQPDLIVPHASGVFVFPRVPVRPLLSVE